MNRSDLQYVAKLRVQEAHALLASDHYSGAYYLIGYAVECALKACIAKRAGRYDFPDKKLVQRVFTHNLETLVLLAELSRDFAAARKANQALDLNWAIVKDWSEEARYDVGITALRARDLYSACTGKNGVLPWVKKRW